MYLVLKMLGFKSFAEAKFQFQRHYGDRGSETAAAKVMWWIPSSGVGRTKHQTLRSEKMEDVIFNGTEVRKPLGLVESLAGHRGLGELRLDAISELPSQRLSEYQELMITRPSLSHIRR